ncbi:MAG: nucleotidyltransferase family protein [Armatimonadota bacterium]|nr:nucleotidyltransferase family protein [Armatimonadota bacterium]MDR5696931.1 nucleotidyltransferase family protein [Armatimonadota bacterium]
MSFQMPQPQAQDERALSALDAVVMAGGGREDALPEGVANKAFLPVGSRPMVEWVLRALRAAPEVRRIGLVAPAPLPDAVASLCDRWIPERGELIHNVVEGLAAFPEAEWILLCGGDLPLLTPAAVSAFVAAALDRGGDFGYGIVRREEVESKFPGARKTFVRVREGSFTGGSLIVVRPSAVTRIRPLIEQAIEARKNPAKLASLFGAKYVMKYAMGQLSVADVERRLHELTGLRGHAVVCAYPEIALDVDVGKPDNLAVAESVLAAGGRG